MTLCDPNVLPLFGVTILDKSFAVTSEWMKNGNVNEFIRANQNANRFELVGSCPCYQPYSMLMRLPPIAQRRRERADLFTWSKSDTWGSEGGTILNANSCPPSDAPFPQDERSNRPRRPPALSRPRTFRFRFRSCKSHHLGFSYECWRRAVDEPGACQSKARFR